MKRQKKEERQGFETGGGGRGVGRGKMVRKWSVVMLAVICVNFLGHSYRKQVHQYSTLLNAFGTYSDHPNAKFISLAH